MDLLWGMRERPTRGPKPVLSVESIARTAVAIADGEGFAAVTMQRVATELNFTKMALYRHTAGKEELVAVMIEAAVGIPPDLSNVEGDWQPKLALWAGCLRETWQRHPWLPGATVGERPMGPNEIGWTECAVAVLEGTGLSGVERMYAVFLISGHVRNTHVASLAGTQPWTMQHRHRLGGFPALLAAVNEAGNQGDGGFAFGMDRILGGLALLIED